MPTDRGTINPNNVTKFKQDDVYKAVKLAFSKKLGALIQLMIKKHGTDERYYLRLNDINKLSKNKRKDIELSDEASGMKMVRNDEILAINYKNGKMMEKRND